MDDEDREKLLELCTEYAKTYRAAIDAEKAADEAVEAFARCGVQFVNVGQTILRDSGTSLNDQEDLVREAVHAAGMDYDTDPTWGFYRKGFAQYRVAEQAKAARLN